MKTLLLVSLAMGAVAASTSLALVGALDADAAAYLNGAAAVISAFALLREKSQVREDIHDLKTRVAVLEAP